MKEFTIGYMFDHEIFEVICEELDDKIVLSVQDYIYPRYFEFEWRRNLYTQMIMDMRND